MLVECPRCHFRQPQDQYCANCGVDMLAYKPKEDPFLIKIAKSGMFQFLMVVLLGIGVTYFVIRTDQPQQWIQKINRFASVSPNPQSPQAQTEAGIAEDQQEFEAPPAAANNWSENRTASPSQMSATISATGTSAGNSTASPTAATTTRQTQIISGTAKLRIRMVEVDHDYIDKFISETKATATPLSGNIKILKYSVFDLENTYFRVLKTDTLEFNKDKKNLFLAAGNSAHGFRINFQEVDDLSGQDARFWNVTFVKNHPNDNQQLPFEVFLYAEDEFVITGSDLISYFELENDLTNTPPFTIFKSPDYRNQKTTFAIIIDLQ